MEKERARLTLDLSPNLVEKLNNLTERHETTKADVLRFAIEFLVAAEKAKNDGLTVGAWKDENGIRTEREFIY